MKNLFRNSLISLALVGLAFAAVADDRIKANQSINEFPTLAAGSIASGDYTIAFDNSAKNWVKVDATTTVGTAFNGTIGATTPNTGAFTSITNTLGITGTVAPTADHATTKIGSKVSYTVPVHTTGSNVDYAYQVSPTISNATGGTNSFAGYRFDAVTGDAQVNVNAISIGTGTTLGTSNAIQIGSGWDAGLVTDSGVQINSTNGTAVTALRFAFDAVASGQTSKTTTLTGVTSSSRCVATAAEVATNSVFLRAAVPGTDQVVVTVSADPGASNMDFTVICLN